MSVRHQDSCIDAQRLVARNGRIVDVQRRAHYLAMCPASCICDIDAPQLPTCHSADAESLMASVWQAISENFPFAFHFLCTFSHTFLADLYEMGHRLSTKWCFPPGMVVIFV